MSNETTMYYERLAAAFVRGKLSSAGEQDPSLEYLWLSALYTLSADEMQRLIQLGKDAGLRLHKFKRTMELQRVRRVLGILKGLNPTDLLDIGSGRGTFLWPLLAEFPKLPVLAVDREERRVADITAVRNGGIETLEARRMDATALELADSAYDVVTVLEVLEHIPDAQRALDEAVRVARRFVVVSAPSTADNNPEHIHLFTRQSLTSMFEQAHAAHVHLDFVLNHIVAVARVTDG